VTSTPNSALLNTTFTGLTLTCPSGHSNCQGFSNPYLFGDVLWQNRSFYVGVGGLGAGTLNQQNLVTLFNAFTSTPAPTQTATGACSTGVTYWDLGVRGDTSQTPGVGSHYSMTPVYSVLTSTTGYSGNHNMSSDPAVVSEYCNGSRQPPECTTGDGCGGYNGFGVPPGIADAVVPNPVFSLTPSATVDEGNNWINVSWGPLSLTNPSLTGGLYGDYGAGSPLGNYALTAASPAVDYIPTSVSPASGAIPATDFFGHTRPDSGTCFDVGAVEFPVTATGSCAAAATPTLTAIAPNTGAQGATVPVTLTGTNFATGATVNVPGGSGITVSGVTVVSGTQITATFTIVGRATLGGKNVTVTTGAGTSGPVTFTVVAPGTPTLASIAPNTGAQGAAVPVTLTGTNFAAGATVNVVAPANGVTVSGVTFVNTTTITATVNMTATANLGARSITVTSGGVTTAPVTFTVVAPAPTLTTIAPNTGAQGAAVPVTLTGTNFAAGATVNVVAPANGVTVSGVTFVNATTITATLTMTATANLGARSITVTSGGVTTAPVTFTVVAPAPTLTAIAPTSGARGSVNLPVTLTGTNFAAGATVNVPGGSGITVNNTTVASATQITATFTIAAGATLQGNSVTVTSGGVTTTSVTFTVVAPGTPTLTAIAPNSGSRSGGTPVPVTLTGTNFVTGASVNVPTGSGITVSGVTVVSPTQITATFAIVGRATLAADNVTVTSGGVTTGPVTFTVTP